MSDTGEQPALQELSHDTLSRMFLSVTDRCGANVAYRHFVGSSDSLVDVTYEDLYQLVLAASGGLRKLGVGAGDRVAIFSDNCLQWVVSDFACICSAVLDVPIYGTLTAGQVAFILKNSGSRLVFVSTSEQAEKALAACDELGLEIPVVIYDADQDCPEGVISWKMFVEGGKEGDLTERQFREKALQIKSFDVVTVLYTSGTTGSPKGVMLTHRNLCSNVEAVGKVVPIFPDDSTLIFLPLCHVLQRTATYLYFATGLEAAFAHSIDTVVKDIRIIRPSILPSVPRLYEKIYATVTGSSRIKKMITQWSKRVAHQWAKETLENRSPGGLLKFKHRIADALVFSKIRKGLGGRIRYFLSGGAPLSPEINRFFFAAGLPILEGYGLTETSPVTHINSFQNFKVGTVGKPVFGTEAKIAEDGEILIRGPQVMKGYYELPEVTEEAIDSDGWFHTGDVGEIDHEGYLRITDRIKDLIITSGGKNIAPQLIENRLISQDYLDQVVMVGNGRPFCSLLVVPDFSRLEEWAMQHGKNFSSRLDVIRDQQVQDLVEEQVLVPLEGVFSSYEIPKKIGLLTTPFTIESGTLTPTQKIKRKVVEVSCSDLVEAFYISDNKETMIITESE
ncbi:MAG: long-chain fatty acid--CoA ligase [Gemmatimonadetes bacterium]|nr:long-chain fatty acid--CoA ligase [Gemmatimonadota bacterium]